jgi:hypothetical protein
MSFEGSETTTWMVSGMGSPTQPTQERAMSGATRTRNMFLFFRIGEVNCKALPLRAR